MEVVVVFIILFIAFFLLAGYIIMPFVKAEDRKSIMGYTIKSLIFCFAIVVAGWISSFFAGKF